MNFYERKLYALLKAPELLDWGSSVVSELKCLKNHLEELKQWWDEENGNTCQGKQAQEISSSSDRVNLHPRKNGENLKLTIHHPISGQKQQVTILQPQSNQPDISCIKEETDAEKVFWWFWRFYPELLSKEQYDALLFPAHTVIPDCPLHSHQSTVSALTGAMFPEGWQDEDPKMPYLLIFSFSPVQDFIKSSRKFLDFWAGSYLLHYLSVRLSWHIAQSLGPDAVILPSLWSQEIIDALIMKKYSDFAPYFACLQDGNAVNRFTDKTSTSLSTAGFPNMITVLVPGKEAAHTWGKELTTKLTEEWVKIGQQVRNCIREKVVGYLKKQTTTDICDLLKEAFGDLVESSLEPYKHELKLLQQESCWEWNKLWDEQLNCSWEPYWAAVPLGRPESALTINKINDDTSFDSNWIKIQQEIAQAINLPSKAEADFYHTLNVGTWWGSLQQRLRMSLQAVKNTRTWQIPTAPGERSTISGQFSAVHPRFNYTKFCEGAGMPAGSMRLFWLVMSKAFPGMFNGSEKLNALELTKRMAWVYGGVAEGLGIDVNNIITNIKSTSKSDQPQEKEVFKIIKENQIIYEQLIRFPNLSSIASARFVHDNPEIARKYWEILNHKIQTQLPKAKNKKFFNSLTRFRSSNVPKTDTKINPHNRKGRNYNGVMFSSKWLIDDMCLQDDHVGELKKLIVQAHQETGFGDASPADWWVIVLADGDGMGGYVSGEKLHTYDSYFVKSSVAEDISGLGELLKTQKRMGPATHIGLNRALLDFSNRLVPYLTERRFCGRVIYSGGDDVKVVLPPEDLPEYILCLRAAWCGSEDPYKEFTNSGNSTSENEATGYWHPTDNVKGMPKRPYFTMGAGATMSMGVVFAHKSVPLPTVLESLWEAEGERAKKMHDKDGICFRVIYGGGNQLEALMKGELLETWWEWVKEYKSYQDHLSPLLYRLAEELPHRACITENDRLLSKAAKVIMDSRDTSKQLAEVFAKIENWLDKWEDLAKQALEKDSKAIGAKPEDLSKLLRFTAFWIDKRIERYKWEEK